MRPRLRPLLVVSGEPSGDALAAPVLSHLAVPSFGLGGPGLVRCGLDPVDDLSNSASMGLRPALKLARPMRAALRLRDAIAERRPRAALLVGFSEFNARLAPALRRRGIKVLWYAPPQVWAWRTGRGPRIAAGCDRLAVLLPFEEALWRGWGADARFVGHPTFDPDRHLSRAAARASLGVDADCTTVGLLPGSRLHELRKHLPLLLGALQELRRTQANITSVLILSPELPHHARREATRRAEAAGVSVGERRDPSRLAAFDVGMVASGTATVDCVAAGVPPVVVYATTRLTTPILKRLVRTPWIGLPNVLLQREAFPELVGNRLSVTGLARATGDVLDSRQHHAAACLEIAGMMGRRKAGPEVARQLQGWLGE